MDIQELVTNSLKDLNVDIIYGWYDADLHKTHITFLEYDNIDSDYVEDTNESEEHYIQADIWAKDGLEAQKLKKQVKQKLKNSGFLFQEGKDDFEMDTKIWHIAQRFYIKEFIEG